MLLRTFVCCVIFLGLKITHVHARGVLTIRLLNFENKKGRTYDGSCCDQTPLDGATCPDQCDYVMRLIVSGLGRANDHVFLFHRPLKYDANDISFQEETTDMVLTILFDEWPKMGHVKMNAFFYDYDDYDHTTLLVDWFENELKRTVNKGNYQRGTVKGNRQADKTSLEFEWSVHCFTKDDCLKPPPEWKSWPWDRKEDQTHAGWSTPKLTSDRPPTTSMDMSNDVVAHKWSDKGWEMSSVAPQGATNDDTPAVVSNINAKDHSSNKITGKTKNKVTGSRDSYKPRKSLSPYGKPTYPKRRQHQSSKATYRRADDRNVLGKNDIVPVAGSSITQKNKEGDVRTTNLRSKNRFHGNSPFAKHGATNPEHNSESKHPSGLRYFSGNADETIEKPTAPYQDGQKDGQATLSETKTTKTIHQSYAPSVKPGEDKTSRDVMNPYTKPKSKTSDQNRRQMNKKLGHSTSYPSTVRHNKNYTPATRKQNSHSKIDGSKSTSFRQSNGRQSVSTTHSMKNGDRGVLTTQPSVGSRRSGNRRGKYGGALKNRYQLVNPVTEKSTHRTQTKFVSNQERKETSKKPSTTKHNLNPAGLGKEKRQPFRSWSRAKETTSTPYTRGQGSRKRSSSSTSVPRKINQQTTVTPTEKMQKETSTKNTWSGRYTTKVSKIINDKRNMNSPFKPTKPSFGTYEDDNENIIATSDRKTDGVKFTKNQETTNNAPVDIPVNGLNQPKKPTSQKTPFNPGQTTKDRSLQNNMIKNLKTAIRDNMRKFVSAITTPTPRNSQSKASADFTNQKPKESSNAHKTYREKADSPDHATESTTYSGPRWTHFTRWWERPQTTPALPTLKVIPAGVNEGKVYDIVDGYKRRKQKANHRSPYRKIETKSRVHDNSGSTRRQGKTGQRRTNQVTLPTHATIGTTKQTSSAPITRSNVQKRQKGWKPKQKKLPYTKPAGRTTSTPRATITQQRKNHVMTEDSEETGNIFQNNKIHQKPTIKANIARTSREPSFRKSTSKNNLHTTESTKRVIKARTRSWRRPLRTTRPSMESTQPSVRGMKGTRRSWIQQSTSQTTSNQVIKRQRPVTQQHLNPVTKQHQKPVTRPHGKPVTKQNQKPVTKQHQRPVTKQHQRPITKYDQEVVTKLYQKPVTKHQQRHVTKHYQIPATEEFQRPKTRATQVPRWGRRYPKSSKSPPLHTTQVTPSRPRTTRKWKRITGRNNINGFQTTNIWQGLMSTRIITTGRTIDYGPQATKPTPFQKKHLPTLKKWNDRQNMKQETLQKSKAHERNRNRKQNSGRTISSPQAPVRRDEQALNKVTKRTPFTRPQSLGRDKSDMTKKTEITKNKPTRSWHRPTQKTQHIRTKDKTTISQVTRRKSDTGTTKSWQRPKNPTTRRSSYKNLQSHMSTPSRPAIVTMKPTRSWRRKTLKSTTEKKAKFDGQMTTSSPTLVPLHIKPTKWWQRKKATLSSADLKKETTTRLSKVTTATKATAQATRYWQRKNLPITTENPTRVIKHKSSPTTDSATEKVMTQTTKSWQRQNTKTTVSARRYTKGRTTETSKYTTTVIPNVVTNKARPTKWWQRRKTATTSKQDMKRTTTISPKALTVKNEPTKWWNRKKTDNLTSRFSNKQTTPATSSTTLNSKPTKWWNRRKGQVTTTAPKLVSYQDNRKVSRVTTIRNRPTKWWQRRKNKPTTSNHEKGVQTTATPRRYVTVSVKPTKQWQRRKDNTTPVHIQKQIDSFSKSPLLPANRNIAHTKSWRRPKAPTTTTKTQKGHSKVAPSINSVTFSVRPTKWWQRRHTTTSIRDVDVVGTTLQTPYNVKVVNTGRPTKWWQRRTQPSKSLTTTQSAIINREKQDNKLATLSRPIPTRSWIRRTTGISTAYTTQGTVSTTIKRNIWNRNPIPDGRNPRRYGEQTATTKSQSHTTTPGKHVSSGTNPANSPKLQGDLKVEMHKTVTSSASTSDTSHVGTSDKSANGGKKGWNIFEFLPDVLSNMYNGKPVTDDDNEEGIRLTSAAAGRSPSPRFNYATKGLKSTVKHDGQRVSTTKTMNKNFMETKRTSSTGSLPSSGRKDNTTPKTRHSITTSRTVRTTPQSRKVSIRSRGTTIGVKHTMKVKTTAEATKKTLTTRKPTTVKQTTTRTTRPTRPATKRATTMTTKTRTTPRKTTTTKPPKMTTKLTTILTTSGSKNNLKSTKSKKERSKKKESRSKAKKKKERVTTTTPASTKSKKKKNNAKSKATESNAKANDSKKKGVNLKKILADFERNKKKNALKIGIDDKKDSKKKVNNKPKTQIDLKKSANNIDFKKPVKKTVKKVNSKTEKKVNSEKKVSSEKNVNSKTANKLEPQPTVISVNSSSDGGPRVNVPNAGLFVPGPGRTKIVKILKSQKDENGTVHEEEVFVAIPSNSEAQHIGLQVKRLNIQTVFNRYWPAILGLTIGTAFLVAAVLTSVACRAQRLYIQRYRYNDQPQHLTEPPDTSEYSSSAASLVSDGTRSSIRL